MLSLVHSVARLVGGTSVGKLGLAAAAAVAFASPNLAQARDHHRRVEVDVHIGAPAPVYQERQVRVWVPPVYRTVVERRFIEPVYRTETTQVFVPDVFEDRPVRVHDHGRTRRRIERVLVAPAHYESREQQVVVVPGHWENVERQELVSEGHYEVHVERVPVDLRPSPVEIVNPMLRGLNIHLGR